MSLIKIKDLPPITSSEVSDIDVIPLSDIEQAKTKKMNMITLKNYIHPDEITSNIHMDSGNLTNNQVISKMEISINTNDKGHVEYLSSNIQTRALTPGDIGAVAIGDITTQTINAATKSQTYNTDTVYTDVATGTNYKLYIENGQIVLEEVA
jgi:hypothetical protein